MAGRTTGSKNLPKPKPISKEETALAQQLALSGYDFDPDNKRNEAIINRVAIRFGIKAKKLNKLLETNLTFIEAVQSHHVELYTIAFERLKHLCEKSNNPVTLIIYLKILDPERFDDQLRRNLHKYKHDIELQRIKNEGLIEASKNIIPQPIILTEEQDIEYEKDLLKAIKEQTKH